MNNVGTITYNNYPQQASQVNGTVLSELMEWLKNIDMNTAGTPTLNITTIGDNNGGRVTL